jgi:hypothetical protein
MLFTWTTDHQVATPRGRWGHVGFTVEKQQQTGFQLALE